MRALVMGTAPCLWEDLEAVADVAFHRVFGVNKGPLLVDDVDVWVSGHPEVMPTYQREWHAQRRGPLPEIVCTRDRLHLVDKDDPPQIDRFAVLRWPGQPAMRQDSGLLAVKVALEEGARHVVVAGVALDMSGNLNETTPEGHSYRRYHRAWGWAARNVFEGRVRGTSGWPAKLLGRPDAEWLASS